MSIDYKGKALCIEGMPLEKVAEAYGTPAYCYSAARVEENYLAYDRALRAELGRGAFTICYAVKANGNVAVLSLLKKLGAGADVVSGGELLRAQKAGTPAAKTVYSGVGKSEAELTAAIKKNLLQINVESESELRLISKIATRLGRKTRIAFRINPDVDAKTHKKITTGRKENKFGIDIDEAPRFYALAARLPGIEASGVAVHIGSQLLSLAPYGAAYRRVAELVRTLRRKGHDITTIDLGGGIGVRYHDEKPPDLSRYARLIREIIAPLGVHIVVEPGRSIVADAGVLLSRVLNVKKTRHKTFVILDAAMNDLMRPALYDAYHAVLPCRKTGAKKTRCDIVGPICETGDTFHTNEMMEPVREGDLVAIMTCGAYGAVMSSAYNTRPPAAEVLVQKGRARLVRKIRTAEDLVAEDIVP
jgi:diaminopimelate decarboxylase